MFLNIVFVIFYLVNIENEIFIEWPGYQYIGETKRQLFVKIKEHIKPTNSAVFSHIEQCKNCQDHDDIVNCFRVIIFCKNQNILLAVEAIMIKKTKLKLNHQLGPDKGYRITLNIYK